MKYLYGASVQGIQNFIFESDKLVEIIGASELVEDICTNFFKDFVGSGFKEENLLIGAAGNIKYIFERREDCEALVYRFPKEVMALAPGVSISQAVVELTTEVKSQDLELLEKRLQASRQSPIVPHGLGLMISERSRRTGKPGVVRERGDLVIDMGQKAKRKKAQQARLIEKLFYPSTPDSRDKQRFPEDISKIAGDRSDGGWIAVIHADGNDLGRRIVGMTGDKIPQSAFRELSKRLERATTRAASRAFMDGVKSQTKDNDIFPFRPIILGGDDLTVIIRGQYAIQFTQVFLQAFEEETKNEFADFEFGDFSKGLTACAGIAFVKPNYPFHYGVRLSDELCKAAKKVSKGLNQDKTPACLLFHKVHSSFVEEYNTIIEQEYITQSSPIKRLDYGPYFLQNQDGYATIEQLNKWVQLLKQQDSPRSRLRHWLTTLEVNADAAAQEMQRIIDIYGNKKYVKELRLKEPFTLRDNGQEHTMILDAINLSVIETNDNEDNNLSN